MSPADIANLVNKAASTAAEAQAEHVGAEYSLNAIETHQLGGEVSSIKDLLTEDTGRRLAYHESGHALVGHWLQAGVVECVTIEPRGKALGVTYITRETEDLLYKQAEFAGRLAMTLAGREAELLVFELLDKSQATCHRLFRIHRDQLDALATRLLERKSCPATN